MHSVIRDRLTLRHSVRLLLCIGVLLSSRAQLARAQVARDTTADSVDTNQPTRRQAAEAVAARATARDTGLRPVGVLRPGDVLKIAVYRNKELTADYLIDSQGYVQIPGLGTIRAAGLDPSQIKEQLVQALVDRGFANPDVAVQPLIRISVLGEVRQPGLFPVDPGTSLIQLLTIAGGPSDRADLKKTTVVREGHVFPVDLQSALGGSASGRIVLYSNDVVVIPAKHGWTKENLSFAISMLSAALTLVNVYVTIHHK